MSFELQVSLQKIHETLRDLFLEGCQYLSGEWEAALNSFYAPVQNNMGSNDSPLECTT